MLFTGTTDNSTKFTTPTKINRQWQTQACFCAMLAGTDQRPVDGLGLCLACELLTGTDTVVGAERNRGLSLIYLKSQSAKDALIIEGISYKQRTVMIHARDTFASREPSTKITISGLRINSSNSEILDYLKTVEVNFRSNIIDECYKDKTGKFTKFKTVRRFFFADLPKINLPETVKLGSGPIGLYYRGQIRAQKAGIAMGMENGDTEDEAEDRETSDEEKCKSEEEKNSEQESPTSSPVHATAGKIDVSNKESGNEAININQENMEDEGHTIELSDGFKSPESQTKATYANQLRKSRRKKKNAPTQKKITDMMHQPRTSTSTSRSPSMKRRGERLERDQSKIQKARALGLEKGQDPNNSK